ncbi:MAG: fibronectin type III domain-containing protein, partial [Thermoguttaceae bacterium]
MRKIRERSLRLECLEDRTLLAVVAGGEESAAAVYAVDAEPMATAAVQLDTPTNVQAVCNSNNRVQVSWDAVPNASQYTVYSQKVGATNWKATVATGTSVTVSGLMATGAYAFKVVANGDGTNYTNSEESAVVKCYPHTSYSTVVTTLTDIKETYTPSGDISFRQAVYFASMMDDTVTFAEGLTGTADLAAFGQITLTGGLTIDGDNRITLTNTGTAGTDRLFFVGASDTGFDVFLRNLTITEFSATNDVDYYNRGGAIFVWNTRFNPANNNFINFTLDHCSVTDCSAADCGGFFYAYGGTIQSTNSTFSENVARYGGAIGILAGDAFLTDSVFTGNTVTGTTSAEGGALYLNTSYGSVIDNCEFSNNTASIS